MILPPEIDFKLLANVSRCCNFCFFADDGLMTERTPLL